MRSQFISFKIPLATPQRREREREELGLQDAQSPDQLVHVLAHGNAGLLLEFGPQASQPPGFTSQLISYCI